MRIHRRTPTAAAALLVALAACASPDTGETTAPTVAPVPTTYRLGLLSAPTTENYWSYLADDASVWTGYVLEEEPATLYRYTPPTGALIPFVADGPPATPVPENGTWTVTQSLRPGLTWSDGSPFTSDDLVFTFETVTRLGLAGRWPATLGLPTPDVPSTTRNERKPGLVAVTAVDPYTVTLTFDGDPGLETWPFTTGTAPILPRRYWEPMAETADTLLAAPATGAPSMGAFLRGVARPGEVARLLPNPRFPLTGARVSIDSDGTAAVDLTGEMPADKAAMSYEEGPFVDEVSYTVYESAGSALTAMTTGDLDLLLSPLGLGNGLRDIAAADDGLVTVTNAVSGYRYLAFNLRKAPLSDQAFRHAIACMIDKDLMADIVLDGAVVPAWSQLTPADRFWGHPGAIRDCDGYSPQRRLEAAVNTLEEAGYRWQTRPGWDVASGTVSPRGVGLVGPDGTPVPTLSLLAPDPGYDPIRTTYAYAVTAWAGDLGIPVVADPAGFDAVVDRVFSTVPVFDMYILAWELTPYPSHLARQFRSGEDLTAGGVNTPGYASPQVDDLISRFLGTHDLVEARSLAWEIDDRLATDLPYVLLYSPTVTEAHRRQVSFPFTTLPGGLQTTGGMPSLVRITGD